MQKVIVRVWNKIPFGSTGHSSLEFTGINGEHYYVSLWPNMHVAQTTKFFHHYRSAFITSFDDDVSKIGKQPDYQKTIMLDTSAMIRELNKIRGKFIQDHTIPKRGMDILHKEYEVDFHMLGDVVSDKFFTCRTQEENCSSLVLALLKKGGLRTAITPYTKNQLLIVGVIFLAFVGLSVGIELTVDKLDDGTINHPIWQPISAAAIGLFTGIFILCCTAHFFYSSCKPILGTGGVINPNGIQRIVEKSLETGEIKEDPTALTIQNEKKLCCSPC